jgi:type II secretory pathway pseudopilin PulG
MNMKQRLKDERGFALVTAILVMGVMMSLGLVIVSAVTTQSHETGQERAAEGAFDVANSALEIQSSQLTRVWPSTAATAYATCTQGTTPNSTCTGTSLNGNYNVSTGGSDFGTAPTWKSQVLDDTGGPDYYDDSIAASAPAWDANGNGSLWVRTQATVVGQTKAMVQLVKSQTIPVTLPQNSITAGWFQTTNNGRKVIVYAQNPDKPGSPTGNVAVRCAATAPSTSSSCLGFDPDKGQLSPSGSWRASYVDPDGTKEVLPSSTRAALKAYAVQLGTYYPAGQCPSSLTGEMIYIENANCSYNANGTANSESAPGVVVFGSGTLSLSGNFTYYGVVYMANGQGNAPSSGPCTQTYQNEVVSMNGQSTIQGAVYIDKCGGLVAGSDKANVIFDSSAASNVKVLGTAEPAKNSFRQL